MSYTVLVVDDDGDLRDSVAEVLGDEGYTVRVAVNGQHALELLRDGLRPDLILLDMMMPVMDGWQFRAAQQRDAGLAAIPVIVFTASDQIAGTVHDLGARGYLKKPPRLHELAAIVERVLEPGS